MFTENVKGAFPVFFYVYIMALSITMPILINNNTECNVRIINPQISSKRTSGSYEMTNTRVRKTVDTLVMLTGVDLY